MDEIRDPGLSTNAAPMRTHGRKTGVAIAVIAVAVIAAAVIALTYGPQQQPGNTSTSTAQNVQSFSVVLSQQPNVTFEGLASAVMGGLYPISLNASYSGALVFTGSWSGLGNPEADMPVSVTYGRYMNSSRLYSSISDIPYVGNLTISATSLADGTSYLCDVTSANATPECTSQHEGAFALLGISDQYGFLNSMHDAVIGVGSTMQTSSFGTCVPVTLNGLYEPSPSYHSHIFNLTQPLINYADSNGIYNISVVACFSNQYYVPVNLTLNMSSNGAVVMLRLHLTSLSSSPSQSWVTSILGSST